MNGLATVSEETLSSEADHRISAVRRATVVAASSLALIVLNEAWDRWQGFKSLNVWAIVLPGSFMLAGVVYLLFALARLNSWREMCTNKVSAAETRATLFQEELLESRKREAALEKNQSVLEQRLVALTAVHSKQEENFQKRKRAEKLLDEQRQELLRSKNVLEVHVQERTQKIQQLQHRYSLILNSAGEGICGLDIQGHATFVNPAAAKISGWEIDELVGRPVLKLLKFTAAKVNADTSGAQVTDHVLTRKDGTTFSAEMLTTAIRENGRDVGAVLIFWDISERKRAEATLAHRAAELARSNAELEQFAFVASHDLQEPLRKIQAFGDRLKIKCEAAQLGDARDYLERMQSAAARMQQLINDLLAFSRVYQSAEPFILVDLDAVVRGVLGDLEVRIEQTRARIETEPLPTIDADPTQMRQLIQNLLSNALKFQPANQIPEIKLTARIFKTEEDLATEIPAGTEYCELVVQDNGIGFEEVYAEKIFAVFQRLHGRSEYEGTGVGLAVCRRITDRHGGAITVRSTPGQGSAFTVTLPVHHHKNITTA
jgi:two-component system sensor kinase FixL